MAGATTLRKGDARAGGLGRAAEARRRIGELEDRQVIQQFLDGDERAFTELVRRYETKLLNFVTRMIGDRALAEDVVQLAFVQVFRHVHAFDQSKNFSSWVYTIARNEANNELRRRSNSPVVYFETLTKNMDQNARPLEWEDPTTRPDDLYRKRCLREKVGEAVKQLTDRHRLVFILREIEGRDYREIAEIAGCNIGTVKSRLNRARNHFARIVAPMIE